MSQLNAKCALVTGASRGIGLAISQELLKEGCSVIGLSRNPAVQTLGSNYVPVAVDLCDSEKLEHTLKKIIKEYPEIDTIISNAGAGAFGHLESLSSTQIRDYLEINLMSHLIVVKHLLPLLKNKKRGDLILMGSQSSLKGGQRGSVYSACKFALRGLAQALREECASCGVRVSILLPGMVRTEFFDDLDFSPGDDVENAIEAEDIAQLVKMILSTRAGTVVDELSLTPLKKVIKR